MRIDSPDSHPARRLYTVNRVLELEPERNLPSTIAGVFCRLLSRQHSERTRIADVRHRRRVVGVVQHVDKCRLKPQPPTYILTPC